jgi:2-polyprenyl-3-methyl-5-hydroxy-6-metoxy-1,4-benzoquinol methylase
VTDQPGITEIDAPAVNDPADEVDPREWYTAQIAQGVERFLEPRAETCSWCGSTALDLHLTSSDIRQGKPGTFTLDKCADCGHVFQNPRLSPEGLNFYYRDAYDGLNSEKAEHNFNTLRPFYRARAELVRDVRPDVPRKWLDIGGGYGHFCEEGQAVFPETGFTMLDMSSGVAEAVRRGRVEHGINGFLLDHADEVAGKFDQVSMFHYLEHTQNPLAEIDAAIGAMTPDGWLTIEQPNPECRGTRLFRSWWVGWLQPEHLNMVTLGNLVEALTERGLEVVTVQKREARMPLEFFSFLTILMRFVAPDPDLPWVTVRFRRLAKIRRLFAMALIGPMVVLVAPIVDRFILERVIPSDVHYRVVARRPGGNRP